jgi:hypothetical protein
MADVAVTDQSAALFLALPNWNLASADFPDHYARPDAWSSVTDMGPELLQDDDPSTRWQSTSGHRLHATIETFFDNGVRPVGALVVGGSSLSRNARIRYRMAIGAGSDVPLRTRQAPNAILSSAGITGSLSDITDDPLSPGGTHLVVTSSTNHVRVGFATPPSFESTVAGAHSFLVRLQTTGGGISVLAADLYQGGVQKENLIADRDGATRFLTVAAGGDVVLEFPFSPSSLSPANGTNLEFRLSASQASGGETRIRAIDLRYQATLPTTDYVDSGLQWAWPSSLLTSLAAEHPTESWAQHRAFVYAHQSAGLWANVADVFQVQIEMHDPWEAAVSASALLVGPLHAVRVRNGLSLGASGRSEVVESMNGSRVFARRRGRMEHGLPFYGTRADLEELQRWLAYREAGIPYGFQLHPSETRYISEVPMVVTTGDGGSPRLEQVERGSKVWQLTGVSVTGFW